MGEKRAMVMVPLHPSWPEEWPRAEIKQPLEIKRLLFFTAQNLVYSWYFINFCRLTQVASNPEEGYMLPESLAQVG